MPATTAQPSDLGSPEDQRARIAELEAIVAAQARRILELETALAASATHHPQTGEQQSARAAVEHAALLDSLLAHAPVGIALIDTELRFQQVNPHLVALSGISEQAHLGRTAREVVPVIGARLEALYRQVLVTGEPLLDVELTGEAVKAPGAQRTWLNSFFPVRSSDGELLGVGTVLSDITERRRAEQEVEEGRRQLATILDTIGEGVLAYRPDGVIVAINATVRQHMRIGAEVDLVSIWDLVRASPLRLAYPDGRALPPEDTPFARLLRGEQFSNLELTLVGADGQMVHWLSFGGVPVFNNGGLVGVCTASDITARKHAEAALRESEARYRTLFETMAQGVVYQDELGRIITANPAAQRIFNLGLSDLTGRSALESGWQAIHEDGTPFTGEEQPAMVALRTGQEVRDVIMGVKHRFLDDFRWLCIQAVPQFGAGSARPTQVYTMFEDITQRKRSEAAVQAQADALSRANAELTRALRLKDEFLAMMSHELRTPLTAVLGITEAMDEGLYGPVSEGQHTALATVLRSGRHLLALLSDILDLAHIEAGNETLERQPLSIDLLCQSALQIVQTAAQQTGIRLLRSIEQGIDGLRGDERRLTQILVNLLDNAVKFTPAGGTVGLEVTADREHECLRFLVWDTGIGIAEADLERLFQPFTQVDGRLSRQYGGVGLGLTLVRRLVEMHGGSVSLTSAPGQGSAFTVSLPWTPADNVAPPRKRPSFSQARAWAQPPRLVIADDHEPTLAFYMELLTLEGCQVAVARNGEEVLAQVRANRPDVVVMDIQMPGIDGLTAIRLLRGEAASATLPIIALTALAMSGDRDRCLAAGANAYLAKPVSLRDLMETISALLPG